jgi:two-component system, OmpR family, response regulator ChvI
VDIYVVLFDIRFECGVYYKSFLNSRETLTLYVQTDPSSYDLVISNIRMPEITGFQLYHKPKAINNVVKVLFATCLEIAEEILTLMPQLTKEQLIQKPIEREKFIEIVNKTII